MIVRNHNYLKKGQEMNRTKLLVGLVGIACFMVFFRFGTGKGRFTGTTYQPGVSDDESDNPLARQLQEWMQLRDPKTKRIPSGIRTKELAFARMIPKAEAVAQSRLQKGEAVTWTSRGPVNQGGRTRALAYDISDATGNTILAGGISGGMWRSTNAGASWTRTTSVSDPVQSVTCLAQDTKSGEEATWYYGTGEILGNSASGGGTNSTYRGDGIFKSTDGGVSWQQLSSTATSTPQSFSSFFDYVNDIAVDPTSGNVYAATYGGIQLSTDGGSSWSFVVGGSTPYSAYTDVAVTSGGIVYAVLSSEGADAGVWRFSGGPLGTWTNISPVGGPSTFNRIVIAVATGLESDVYFLGDTPGSGFFDATSGDYTSLWKYSYISGSGAGAGGSWSDRSANLPNFGGKVGNFSHQGGYDLIVRTKPDNPNFVFIGGTNLYSSSDGFSTTTKTAWIGGYDTTNDVSLYPHQHSDEHSMTFKPGNPATMLVGCDGGLSMTVNDSVKGVSWTFLNNGYLTSQFYSVAIDEATAGDLTIIGGMQDNGNMVTTSANGSQAWVVMPGGGDGTMSAVANGRAYYYIGTQNGTILRLSVQPSYSTPYSWTVVRPVGSSGYLFVTPYKLDPNNSNIMYLAAGEEVWRNSDLSQIADFKDSTSTNWTALSGTSLPGHFITAIGVSTDPPNTIYYGTDSTQVFRIDNANTATGATSPTEVTDAGFPSGAYVSCIAVNPRNVDTAIVVFSNYNIASLFLTTDGGLSWASVGGNLEQNPDGTGDGPSCRWATILPNGPGCQFYVATSTGVYSTDNLNGGSTVWAQEGSDVMGNVVTTMVVSRSSDSTVIAATHGNGVFSTKWVATTGVQQLQRSAPRNFALSQNYPNPFNPTTTIQFDVPKAGNVHLGVYDVTGREVATLFEGMRAAGSYRATWDGKNSDHVQATSGVYFCRLQSGTLSATRKMVLMK